MHGLARKIADKRFEGHAPRKMVEQARRDLNRYLSGRFNPGPAKRREIATALGLESSALDEEEDVFPQTLLDRIPSAVGPPEIPARGLYENVNEDLARHFLRSAMHSLARVVEIEKELA